MTYAFPDDLLAARRAWVDACEAVAALPTRRVVLGDGTVLREGVEGTPALDEESAATRRRLGELSVAVMMHPFWETLTGAERTKAREALRAATEQPVDAG